MYYRYPDSNKFSCLYVIIQIVVIFGHIFLLASICLSVCSVTQELMKEIFARLETEEFYNPSSVKIRQQ